MGIREHEPANSETPYISRLWFYGAQMDTPVIYSKLRNPIVIIDHISILCAHIKLSAGEPRRPTISRSFNRLPDRVAYPSEKIVELCAAQTGFLRLQLRFENYEDLVQFMATQRTALDKLDGRVALFYCTEEWQLRAADFETLEDLGGTPMLLSL